MAKFTVSGADDLVKQLQAIRKTKAKSAIRKGSRQGSKIIQRECVDKAPRKTGAMSRGIKVRALPRSRKWVGTMVRFAMENFYGRFIDLGTKYIQARRFMRDSVRAKQQQAVNTMVDQIREELNVR